MDLRRGDGGEIGAHVPEFGSPNYRKRKANIGSGFGVDGVWCGGRPCKKIRKRVDSSLITYLDVPPGRGPFVLNANNKQHGDRRKRERERERETIEDFRISRKERERERERHGGDLI